MKLCSVSLKLKECTFKTHKYLCFIYQSGKKLSIDNSVLISITSKDTLCYGETCNATLASSLLSCDSTVSLLSI